MPRLSIRTEIGAAPERCFDLSRKYRSPCCVHGRLPGTGGGRRHLRAHRLRSGGELGGSALRSNVAHDIPITEFHPPGRFVDEMVRGPFRRFRHEHRFEPSGEGTLMTDLVEFQMPGWFLVNTVATAYLRHLLVVRNALLRSEAERG